MDLNCFEACDIRGRVPDELNKNFAGRIGNAEDQRLGSDPVVLGRDIRLSNPMLHDGLISGINAARHDIFDIGLCGTEEVYFRTAHRGTARRCRP